MRKICIFTLTLCTLFLAISLLPVHGETQIYDNVLRLHVLANSDSEEDQALKLAVRDALLTAGEGMFANCTTREEAATLAQERLPFFEEVARKTVGDAGYDYDVSVILDVEEYPTRTYDAICFPAGEYLSLRVLIGQGAGQNWWCVLFPPMCMTSATAAKEDASIPVGLSSQQYQTVTQSQKTTYAVRFKILDSIREVVDGWKK